jgi:hypothetical protein
MLTRARGIRRKGKHRSWAWVMPIRELLKEQSFGPDEIKVLVTAFEDALHKLGLDRNDPQALLLAKGLIARAQQGERDPARWYD